MTWWLGHQATFPSSAWCWKATVKRGTLFAFTVLLLTTAHGYRYYNEPQLTISSVAPQTEFAPEDRDIVDPIATKAREDTLRDEAIQALQVDETLNDDMQEALNSLWADIDRVTPLIPEFPFVPTDILSKQVESEVGKAPASVVGGEKIDKRLGCLG
ncbi:MAG: hypothetical protein AAFY15_15170, partial [Cyanobacteria bacterium J06648_11]